MLYLIGLIFVVIAAIVIVVPQLGAAAAVGVIVGCVVLVGFGVWIVSSGGGFGGWGDSGRMGN